MARRLWFVIALVVAGALALPPSAGAAGGLGRSIVTGTVVAHDSGAGLDGICVQGVVADSVAALSQFTSTLGGRYVVEFATTGPVSYLAAVDCTNHAYAQRVVQVAKDSPLLVTTDITLYRGAHLDGVVRDASTAQPVGGLCVSAFGTASISGGDASQFFIPTDGAGHYATGPFNPGTVKLLTAPCDQNGPWRSCIAANGQASPLCPPLWVQSPYASTVTAAVAVSEAQNVTVDVAAPVGGAIEGTVTNAAGQPMAGASVIAVPTPNTAIAGVAYTDQQGHYRVEGLSAATYTLHFSPHFNSLDFATSGPISVALGQVITGIDAVAPT